VLNYPKALPFYPAYAYLHHAPQDFPVAYANQTRILSLPIYPELPNEAIEEIALEIENAFKPTRGQSRNRGVAQPVLMSDMTR
jgi:dTDP-4-amino-4,6-dideoxygalactose transaminase